MRSSRRGEGQNVVHGISRHAGASSAEQLLRTREPTFRECPEDVPFRSEPGPEKESQISWRRPASRVDSILHALCERIPAFKSTTKHAHRLERCERRTLHSEERIVEW